MNVHNGRETSCPETGWGLTRTRLRRTDMTTLQAWILIILVGIIALAYLVGLFRGRAV